MRSRSSFFSGRLPSAPRPRPASRPLHGLLEPGRVDRLQQVVDGVDLERLDRVLVVRRHEHHARRRRPRASSCRATSNPGQPGHLHVQEHHVRARGPRPARAPRRRWRPGPTTSTPAEPARAGSPARPGPVVHRPRPAARRSMSRRSRGSRSADQFGDLHPGAACPARARCRASAR